MTVTDLELVTPRLRLRTPVANDADALQAMAADPRVALTTASVPHPYPDGGALAFIEHVRSVAGPERQNLAITLTEGELIGMIGFAPVKEGAELSYMVSPAYWGRGYATEAAARLVAYIFEKTRFPAVIARCMASNRASANVLQRVGFRWEGEADVNLPARGGSVRTTFWKRERLHPAS